MSMTKKEIAEMEELKMKLALHFYPEVKPEPLCQPVLNEWLEKEYRRANNE